MSARRVGQRVFDWVRIASRVPEQARADFNSFRARYEACKASLAVLPEKPEPIDWDYYSRNVTLPGLVTEFQTKFQALKVPYPKDTTSATITEQQKQIEVEAQEAIAHAKERATVLQQELDEVLAQKPYEDMTIDEYLEDKPELRTEAETDLKNNVFYLPDGSKP